MINEPEQNPATATIVPGKETTIEIQKGKSGLGLSIVGGSDTLLVSRLFHSLLVMSSVMMLMISLMIAMMMVMDEEKEKNGNGDDD